jgi:hypothetical protein
VTGGGGGWVGWFSFQVVFISGPVHLRRSGRISSLHLQHEML